VTGLAFKVDGASVRLDDSSCNVQVETGTFPAVLRREEKGDEAGMLFRQCAFQYIEQIF
jgi:hypothetical protein